MGFNDQNEALGGRGARKFIFKEGVRYKHMTGQQQILFRLMPAFNPADQNPGTSYLPCLDRNGKLTEWGAYLRMVRFVGHGKGGESRRDLLSLKTIEQPGQPIFCPLEALYQTINSDMQTWGYLIDEGDRKDKNRPRPAYGKLASMMIANVLDANAAQNGVQLGVFTTGAANKLCDKREGLVFQPNVSQGAEDAAKTNYMAAYANGDITCPVYAPLFVVEKDTDKGDFSGYKVTVALDQTRRVIRRPVDQALMAQRYNLSKLDTFLNIPTEDELVQSLVQLLNMRSPMGYHEHALLRMAFPNHQIPEPPAAPAASPMMAMGGYQIPGAPVQGGGFPMSAGMGGGYPNAAGPGGYPNAAGIPGVPPPQGYPPAGQYQTPPGVGVGVPIPGAGLAVPVPPPEAYTPPPTIVIPGAAPTQALVSGPAPEAHGAAANAAAAGVPPAGMPVGGPVAPGDPVTGFDQAAFVARLRGGQG